jgi:hypothetical protein
MATNNMNYKPLFIDKVSEYTEKLPDYTIGEILYSVFTQLSKEGLDVNSKRFLLNLTDKQVYSAIDKAIKEETE